MNVSRGGVFVHTSEPLTPGRRILVEIQLPGGPPIEAIGRVAWVKHQLATDLTMGIGPTSHSFFCSGQREYMGRLVLNRKTIKLAKNKIFEFYIINYIKTKFEYFVGFIQSYTTLNSLVYPNALYILLKTVYLFIIFEVNNSLSV